jgi:dihydroorotate dehydrogenase
MYRQLIRPYFFLYSPEIAHYKALHALSLLLKIPGGKAICRALYMPVRPKPVKVFGLQFPNELGLAAGFDKNAAYIHIMAYLGFGHIEIGTVTPKPQSGNPQPRLFRLPADKALINRMGFNNDGVDAVVAHLQKPEVVQVRKKLGVLVGGNIGKNKVTPNEDAWKDYAICFEKLFDHVDYFVVNVSSPNTPGLRELQDKGPLLHILKTLQDINEQKSAPKPLLLKIAPDLNEGQLNDIAEVAVAARLSGLIISNTTIDRTGLRTTPEEIERIGDGGLSGLPVQKKSDQVLTYMRQQLPANMHIIGVGGVFTRADAQRKLQAGASLVQVYTGFIYEGPAMAKRILRH